MGGNAFAADGLYTPRMPPKVYSEALEATVQILRGIYAQVEPLLEAPGKQDYGDIDILVVSQDRRAPSDDVAKLLDAVRYKETKGNDTVNYAIPWPRSNPVGSDDGEMASDSASGAQHSKSLLTNSDTQSRTRYIQVDINHNKDSKSLLLTGFLHAHGDIWLMIATMIRDYGLTNTDDGLCIRIPELETWDKKRSRVKLTDDPDKVLGYLGLDIKKYWRPFASQEDLMEYVTTCRFYNPKKMSAKHEDKAYGEVKREEKKRHQRPMFAYWLDVYLPAHRDAPPGTSGDMTREDVIFEAKETFGSRFAEAYERQKHDGLRDKNVTALWAEIRKQIPCEGPTLGYAMKGLKAKVGAPSEPTDDASLHEAREGLLSGQDEAVKKWALANWQAIGEAQETADKEKTQEILRQKFAKVQ